MQQHQQEGYIFGQSASHGSNIYANGSKQNCGTVITDRPTSRVLAPPGGGSSFSIGWDTSENPHRKENRNNNPNTNNTFSPADYQNSNTRYGKGGSRNESSIKFTDYNPNDQQIEPYQKQRSQHSQQQSQIFQEQPAFQQQQQQQPYSQQYPPHQQQYNQQPPQQQYNQQYNQQPPQQQYNQQPPQQQYNQQPPQQQYNQQYNQQPPQQQYNQQYNQQPPQQQYNQQPPQKQYNQQEPTFGARVDRGSNSFANGSNQNCGNYLTDRPTSRVLAPPGGKSNFSLG
jgi:hypothetical protein